MSILVHLKERGLQPHRYNFAYDDNEACFYLYNLSGQIVGYQKYNPSGTKNKNNDEDVSKYYTYCKNKLGVFGLETLSYRDDVLYLTEGLFDAIKLHNQELPAIATLSNDPKHLASWFFIIKKTRRLIGACDADEAGRKLKKYCDLAYELDEFHDLGSMTDDQVKKWLDSFDEIW